MENTHLPPRLDEDGLPVKDPNPNVFEIYSREAKVYDAAMIERWRTAMEGILIFAGLFSAAVTAFIIESYKTLQPDPANRTVYLLNQISQQLASAPISAVPDAPFSPSWTDVATNILWFISLGSSLACAVAATLVQQWARNYVQTIERRPSAKRRARMRMYLFEGVERFGMSQLIDGIPALLHLSLFTFFLGLVFFICGISTPVTAVAIIILVITAMVYATATVLPLIAYDSPIQTPLTSVVWQPAFIRMLYWVCAHTILVVVALRSFSGTFVQPCIPVWLKVIDLVMQPFASAWTAIDLVSRQFFSLLHTLLIPAPPSLTGSSSPSSSLLSLPSPQSRRTKILEQWSQVPLSGQALDTVRASIVRDDSPPAFWQREQRAFIWLAHFLDEDRELLPFLEALPSYAEDGNREAEYILQMSSRECETISAMLLHPTLKLLQRSDQLRQNYPESLRVNKASLNFQLLITDVTLSSTFSTAPEDLTYFQPYDHDHLLRYSLSDPDDIRQLCLMTVATVVWCQAESSSRTESDGEHVERHSLLFFNTLHNQSQTKDWFFQTCLGRGLSVLPPSSIGVWHRLPYFIISQYYLSAIPKMTTENMKYIADTLIRLHDQMHTLHSVSSSPFSAFPQQELLYCTMMELVIRLLEECSEELLRSLPLAVFWCFNGLPFVENQSSFDVVRLILESGAWGKCSGLRYRFCNIVLSIRGSRREPLLSETIMRKFWVLRIGPGWDTVSPSLDLTMASSDVQRFFVSAMTRWSVPLNMFATLIQQFAKLDDLPALEEAIVVTDTYLRNNSDESGEVVRCLEYLRSVVQSKHRCEVGVQVFIRPEIAVQAS